MFWTIVGIVLVVVLVGAWVYDRRHSVRTGGIKPAWQDDTVGEAKAQSYTRNDISGLGPLNGP